MTVLGLGKIVSIQIKIRDVNRGIYFSGCRHCPGVSLYHTEILKMRFE